MKSENEVAFLVYAPEKQRRQDNSFDGNDNIGAKVIADILRKHNVNVGFCAPETANKYKIVLVSLTSTYDVYALYKAVALRPEWQRKKRTFKVVAGGFGMQNPYPIRNFVDVAVFGRAEKIIVHLVSSLLDGKTFEHESVMNLPEIHPVKIAQAEELYTSEVFSEEFIGCPNKCLFCHYTWARKPIGKSKTYVQGTLTGGNSPELLFNDLAQVTQKCGRIRTALDGFSERLRFAYGKTISNETIINNIQHIGSFEGNTVVICYNIGNYPGEMQSDRLEFDNVMRTINPKNRVIIILHTTPFRPSLATPMQFAPVSLYPAYTKFRFQAVVDTPHLLVKHSMSNESPFSQLQSVVAERATDKSDNLFHTICFSPKLKSAVADQAVMMLKKNFDLSPYLKSYEYGEQPGKFLETFTHSSKLFEIYKQKML